MVDKSGMSPVSVALMTAALKIASANHYMVGFDASSTEGLSFDDISDANQLLIDTENTDTKQQHKYDRAFMVLDALCFRLHRAHLSH